jgi:acetyltransferase-like isoleucine patch superfamily enzyme
MSLSARRSTFERARSALWLRKVTRCGHGVFADGQPLILNSGSMSLGDGARLSSHPVQSHFVASEGAVLEIGKRVSISYGAAISAQSGVRIGDDTTVGPFVVIMDSDFHVAGDRSAHSAATPITIGRGVTIEARVTVLRGSTIGDGARIKSGSVVSGHIPASAVVGGVPARSLVKESRSEMADLPTLVMRVLNLSALPNLKDGPDQIPQWDSLGSLKLLLALEQTFGVTIGERQLKAAQSVAGLAEIVRAASAPA